VTGHPQQIAPKKPLFAEAAAPCAFSLKTTDLIPMDKLSDAHALARTILSATKESIETLLCAVNSVVKEARELRDERAYIRPQMLPEAEILRRGIATQGYSSEKILRHQ
jgi:hypothetical protein